MILTSQSGCPQDIRPFVTVFVPEGAADVGALFDLSDQCGFRVRFETLKMGYDGVSGTIGLALGSGAFGGERIFR